MPLRLVAIGDSTVEGLEDPGPDGAYVGWADRFARQLDVLYRVVLYANLAVRGQTARQVRQTQLQPALALAPDLAVVVAGVNDVRQPRLDREALRADLFTMHAEPCAGRACRGRLGRLAPASLGLGTGAWAVPGGRPGVQAA